MCQNELDELKNVDQPFINSIAQEEGTENTAGERVVFASTFQVVMQEISEIASVYNGFLTTIL